MSAVDLGKLLFVLVLLEQTKLLHSKSCGSEVFLCNLIIDMSLLERELEFFQSSGGNMCAPLSQVV